MVIPIPYKIGVSGSRKNRFTYYDIGKKMVTDILKSICKEYHYVIFGHGACPYGGVDSIVNEFCKENNIPVKVFPPYYNLPSPERYHKRNRELVEWSDIVICIFAEEIYIGGTYYVMRYAKKLGKRLVVYIVDTVNEMWIRKEVI